MQPDFWHERWALQRIGFHSAETHRLLVEHWPRIGPRKDEAVLVPLCGKSLDLWWLRDHGHRVIGVELSPLAVEAFFREANITPTRTPVGAHERFEGGGVTVLCGDFFAVRPEDVADCRLVFNRASMVALPPDLRARYVAHLRALAPTGTRMLLITFEYNQAQMGGPPFAVSEAEVRRAYTDVETLVVEDILVREPRFRERGVTSLHESAFAVRL